MFSCAHPTPQVLKPRSRKDKGNLKSNCGEGGIRTLEELSPLPVFETGSFDHSDTSPSAYRTTLPFHACDPCQDEPRTRSKQILAIFESAAILSTSAPI